MKNFSIVVISSITLFLICLLPMAHALIHGGSTLPLSPTQLPAEYNGFVLPNGSTCTFFDQNLGRIIIQELQLPFCHLRLIAFELLQALTIDTRLPDGWLYSVHALKNTFSLRGKWLVEMDLQQAEFALFQTYTQVMTLAFPMQGNYHLLEVAWTEHACREYAPGVSALEDLFNQRNVKREHLLHHPFRSIAPSATGLPFNTSHGDLNGAAQALFAHQVKGYLLTMLVATENDGQSGIHPSDKAVLAALEEKIRTRPADRYHMADLAISLNMNEKKINKLFTLLYGSSVFEYHLKCRMEEAHRLLQETGMTTKEVSLKIGYTSNPSFIRQFLEYFDYPPSRIQGLG